MHWQKLDHALRAVARDGERMNMVASDPAMLVQATYLAFIVSVVEELIFRGAFVLVAAGTPLITLLASVGSAIAYVVWRAVTYRDRDPRFGIGPHCHPIRVGGRQRLSGWCVIRSMHRGA